MRAALELLREFADTLTQLDSQSAFRFLHRVAESILIDAGLVDSMVIEGHLATVEIVL